MIIIHIKLSRDGGVVFRNVAVRTVAVRNVALQLMWRSLFSVYNIVAYILKYNK